MTFMLCRDQAISLDKLNEDSAPLVLMSLEAIEAELIALRKRLRLSATGSPPDMSEGEWEAFIERFSLALESAGLDLVLAKNDRQGAAHRLRL